MKKWLLPMILLSGLTLTTSACSPSDEPGKTEAPTQTPDPDPQPGGNSRAIVVYFSCTNTTKGIADRIVSITGSKTYRIEPEVPYTFADLDYNNSSSRANREQNDPSARPEIADIPEDLSNYDVIFLGYPIWWGKAPKIIFTFLESQNLAGKTIVPFCTSHSSGLGTSDTNLHSSASQAEWKRGRRFSGSESEATIKDWIEGLGLNLNDNSDVSSFNLAAGTNGNAPTVRLSSGYDMPSDWGRTACLEMYVSIPLWRHFNVASESLTRLICMTTRRAWVKAYAVREYHARRYSFALNSIPTSMPMRKMLLTWL